MSRIIKNDTRNEWLSERKKGLGGTDIAAVCGVNPYRTPYDVWLDKTNNAPKFEGNKFTKRGEYMEDAVANYFEDVTECRIIKASETNELYIHDDFDFLLGSPDRRYITKENNKGILECKTTMSKFTDLPDSWFIQTQWYMGHAGYNEGCIAWAELGFSSEFRHVFIKFDKEFYDKLVKIGVDFWNNHVLTGKEPEPINSEDVEKMFPYAIEGESIEAQSEMLQIISELKQYKSEKKKIDTEIEKREEMLKLAMKSAELIKSNGIILATWKASKSSLKFDSKRFEAENSEIFMAYQIEVPGTRRFLLK